MHTEKGCLFVVATPIGNLEDISLRALNTLKSVDLIVAEDTRHSKKLLAHFNINTPLSAYHDYSKPAVTEKIIRRLTEGNNIALISDAGTPLISDPGYRLVSIAHEQGVRVRPLPGPCALICALCVAGLPSDRFLFTGYLPAKPCARKKEIEQMAESTYTWIFYETPHRIVHSLADLMHTMGPARKITIARELTKHFETVLSGTAEEIYSRVSETPEQQKGEFVVLVAGKEKEKPAVTLQAEQMMKTLMSELSLKQASSVAAKLTGIQKRELYNLGLKLNLQS